jgi:hypothetical protein
MIFSPICLGFIFIFIFLSSLGFCFLGDAWHRESLGSFILLFFSLLFCSFLIFSSSNCCMYSFLVYILPFSTRSPFSVFSTLVYSLRSVWLLLLLFIYLFLFLYFFCLSEGMSLVPFYGASVGKFGCLTFAYC